MIIGIDASRANLQQKTGVEWYSYFLIKHLANIDNQNEYILYTNTKLKDDLSKLGSNFKEAILSWPFSRLWTQGRLSLEMLFKPPHILFIPASAMPLIHRNRTITVIHDIAFERYPDLYTVNELRYHRWSTKFALENAKSVITISNFSKKELVEKYFANPEKIKVIYLGFDKEKYRPIYDKEKIQAVLAKYKITQPYILYIGKLSKKKNVKRIISAFSYFNNSPIVTKKWNLVLVGKSSYGYDEIEQAIQTSGRIDQIICPGWVDELDIPYLLNGARLFIFPSLYEGFGLPILEAMACGVPVIASMSGAIPEIAQNACYLINPYDTGSIYRAIKHVLEDNDLRMEMIYKGLKRVKEFSWDKCAKDTLKVFKENEPTKI